MEVKILTGKTAMELECNINAFLAGRQNSIVDIKFNRSYIPISADNGYRTNYTARYCAMIVYDENM